MTASEIVIEEPDLNPIDHHEGVARATGVLALGNIASRVLGLVREIMLTNLFGATAAVDAFNVAVLVPKGLYDLLIGGHVNGAIIPVLSEVVALKGRDELWRLVSVLLSMLTLLLAMLVVGLEIGAPAVVNVVGGGLDEQTQQLATSLLRLTAPALLFMSGFAILSGTLYALHVFTWPAFATAVFNGSIIVITLLFVPPPRFGIALDGTWTLARPASGIRVVAIGWLIGSMAYMLLQVPGLRGANIRFTLNWRHPAIRQIGLLYIPVMFSLVMDTLIIRPFSYNLASQTGEGSIGIMIWATTLIQFPQGLVATAISIAILPTLSQQAARMRQGAKQINTYRDTLGLGMRLAITLILPATVGLFVLASPIIGLLFEHGAFTSAAADTTTSVLRLYLIGLPFAAVDLLLVYAFYAHQDTLTPALIGLFSLLIYMVTAWLLIPALGLFSLMIADSIKHILHAIISGVLLYRRMNGLGQQRLVLTVLQTALASAGMGIVAWGSLLIFAKTIGTTGLFNEILLVAVCAGVSGVTFAILAYLLKIEEWRWLLKLVSSRLL